MINLLMEGQVQNNDKQLISIVPINQSKNVIKKISYVQLCRAFDELQTHIFNIFNHIVSEKSKRTFLMNLTLFLIKSDNYRFSAMNGVNLRRSVHSSNFLRNCALDRATKCTIWKFSNVFAIALKLLCTNDYYIIFRSFFSIFYKIFIFFSLLLIEL